MLNSYLTIKKEAHTEIIEKKSRFIAHVFPVDSEEEANEFISAIKSKYWDATHNVYAYVIGKNFIQKFSDDGEPKGTAGMPVLQVIKNMELQNIVVVVTRYFGGILLGAGGLVRAYGKAAKEGIIEGEIVKNVYWTKVKITTEYTFIGKIQTKITELGYIIKNTIYEDSVTFEILLPNEELEKFEKELTEILYGKPDIIILGNENIVINI